MALSMTSTARAQLSQPPATKDWTWPLYEIDRTAFANGDGIVSTTVARPAVWTSHAEFEEFTHGTSPLSIDVHPGIDIRGDDGDAVVFPREGTIVHISNQQLCDAGNTPVCRIWVRTPDNAYLYYVGHVDVTQAPNDPILGPFRDVVSRALDASNLPTVTKGSLASQLFKFPAALGEWSHVHVGVFDRQDNYASLDPLAFLNRTAVGQNGSTLAIIDDEPPTVKSLDFRPDTALDASSSVNPSGFCGQEVHGAIDITADIKDTFYTNRPAPDPFVNDTQLPTMGIKGARYVTRNLAVAGAGTPQQWFTSPTPCNYTGCGVWRFRFGAAVRSGLTSDDAWFTLLNEGAPTFMGDDFVRQLWDEGPSANDHESTTEVPFIHLLTNGITETSGTSANAAWIPSADGRYIVTAEAWDFDGNLAEQSVIVTVNNSGLTAPPGTPTKGWSEVYVKDHPNDFGQIPSDLGGERWWNSPDIIVADFGTTVTTTTPARGEQLVVGQHYSVYVRVHNSGCQEMTGVQAAVYSATPGTMLTEIRNISTDGVYDGTPVTVPAQSDALVGPFDWNPTQADLGTSQGHRCLLAAINSQLDPGPAVPPAQWVPKNDDNIAQRNVQFADLSMAIKNATGSSSSSSLQIDMGTFPTSTQGAQFEFLVDDPAVELEPLWSGTPNTVVSREGNNVVVRVLAQKVTLPAFSMPAVSQRAATARFALPDGSGPHDVGISHSLNGIVVGGMDFQLTGQGVIR